VSLHRRRVHPSPHRSRELREPAAIPAAGIRTAGIRPGRAARYCEAPPACRRSCRPTPCDLPARTLDPVGRRAARPADRHRLGELRGPAALLPARPRSRSDPRRGSPAARGRRCDHESGEQRVALPASGWERWSALQPTGCASQLPNRQPSGPAGAAAGPPEVRAGQRHGGRPDSARARWSRRSRSTVIPARGLLGIHPARAVVPQPAGPASGPERSSGPSIRARTSASEQPWADP